MNNPRTPFALPALALALSLAPLTAHALTPAHFWSQRFGDTGSDIAFSAATDASGNVLVTGMFTGTVNFGGSNLVSAGGTDIFVAKYDAAGVHQWSKSFGSTGSDVGNSIAVDVGGNVVVTGTFQGTVNFGGVGLISAGADDIFVAKYNSAGGHQWSQRFGSTGSDIGYSVAVDAPGNVAVTGAFANTVDFGGGNLVSAGLTDVYVAKYNSAGVHQWSQRFGNTQGDQGYSIATDASGNVFVTGFFQGTVGFGGANLVSAGSLDIFAAKYNSAGVHQWSQRFGSTSTDSGNSVATDASGNVFVTGVFNLTVNFGGTNLISAGAGDIFLAKYDAAGVHQWSQRFGGSAGDASDAVAADASGSVILTGLFSNTANFGGGDFVSAGSGDIFVAKYKSSTGAYVWSVHSGDTQGEAGRGLATDGAGNVFATGNFQVTGNFGGSTLVSAGSNDVFLVKYGPEAAEPVISAITDVGNDQGRRVNIRFARSGHDGAGSASPIASYEVYRRDDAPPALLLLPAAPSRRALLDLGWTFVGEMPAHGQPSYAMDVPTIGDSTLTLGQYYSSYFVRGASASPLTYFDSPADSGYSVDNLAPGAPQNFVYNAGALSWKESSAADFDFFTVYGSNTNSFGAATVVDYSVAPGMNVVASPYVYYFVTATDFSGNEGKPAKVNTLSGVGGTPKNYVLSVSNYPNPFNPSTTVSYTVPSRGAVTVAVYDARGALVATLLDHTDRAAGAYSIEWDGRAQSGATVSTGVYFVRIEHNGATRSKKMVLLK